jgi:hypothetical protein
MTTRATSVLADIIRSLGHEAATQASPSEMRDAASRAGGVPVYEDLGGVLVITPEREVRHYDPESGQVKLVTHQGWRLFALAKAAAKFPELQPLRPPRPGTATDCARCKGTGIVMERLDCGACFGVGWVAKTD